MSQATICQAIGSRNYIQFYYDGNEAVGYRTVKPCTVGYNKADHLSLSAWYVSGVSESEEGPGWREYLLKSISQVTILQEKFDAAPPGYVRGGGKLLHNAVCDL
jgi:hypothetical protein